MPATILFAELPSLAGLYVIALIVGGGMIAFSALTGGDADSSVDAGDVDFGGDVDLDGAEIGGGDVDLDSDIGADTDVAVDHHGEFALSDWFSLRFLVYFTAMFGLTGTALTMADDLGRGAILALSVISGAIVGQIVHQMMRWLVKNSSDSATTPADYINRVARVTIAIPNGGRGEIAVLVKNSERYLPAVAKREEDSFKSGDTVGVIEISAGTAVVVSRKEFDFLND